MAIVVVLVLLIAVGIGVGVAVSGKNKKSTPDTSTNSFVSPTRPTFSQATTTPVEAAAPPAADARTAAARASEAGSGIAPSSGLPKLGYEKEKATSKPATPEAHEAPAAALAATSKAGETADDEPDEDLSNRFNRPGERATTTEAYVPTVPRKPVLLTVTDPTTAQSEPEPDAAEVAADTAEAEAAEVEVEAVAEVEPIIEAADDVDEIDEPEFVLLDAGSSSIEDDVVADVVASAEAAEAAEAVSDAVVADTVVIELDESSEDEPVLVLEDGPVPLDEVETNENDNVLKALIGRVRVTQDDVDAVATELGRRDDLDAEGVDKVLADLAEIAAAEAEREEELTLFSEEVPSRPGQLTRFAELGATERRRVIIRVLCLLVARAEDGLGDASDGDEDRPSRAMWPGEEADDAEELDLPNRVGLVKS